MSNTNDTLGLISSFLNGLTEANQAATNPVGPDGEPVHDILTKTNRYGPAIPSTTLYMFRPGTKNLKTIQSNTPGEILYAGKVYPVHTGEKMSQLNNIQNGVSHINNLVNKMIQLRGNTAYELISGHGDKSNNNDPNVMAMNDIRETAMNQRDYATTFNSWVVFILTIVISLWLFTFTYSIITSLGNSTSFVSALSKHITMLIVPGVVLGMMLIGYMTIPNYSVYLPSAGTKNNEF